MKYASALANVMASLSGEKRPSAQKCFARVRQLSTKSESAAFPAEFPAVGFSQPGLGCAVAWLAPAFMRSTLPELKNPRKRPLGPVGSIQQI